MCQQIVHASIWKVSGADRVAVSAGRDDLCEERVEVAAVLEDLVRVEDVDVLEVPVPMEPVDLLGSQRLRRPNRGRMKP